jgi:hypothetical protein
MSARTLLVADLTAALPTFDVIGFNENLDAIRKPTLMVWQDKVTRPDLLALSQIEVELSLWVLVGAETKPDDTLDAALEDVLFAIEPMSWVRWTLAERGVFASQFHGYKITATAVATITPDEGA